MKITKAKKKNARWIITVETEEDERLLVHSFGCRNSIHSCYETQIRNDEFQHRFYNLLADSGLKA